MTLFLGFYLDKYILINSVITVLIDIGMKTYDVSKKRRLRYIWYCFYKSRGFILFGYLPFYSNKGIVHV